MNILERTGIILISCMTMLLITLRMIHWDDHELIIYDPDLISGLGCSKQR
jgi:hypothetical protein